MGGFCGPTTVIGVVELTGGAHRALCPTAENRSNFRPDPPARFISSADDFGGSDHKREAAQKTRAEEDLKAIFSLARRLGATRSLQTDVGRDDCLLRAAEVVLQSPTAAGLFVATYRDGFRRMCRAENTRGGTSCEKCGGPLVERTAHDEVLNERMPIWTCMRCRAETPR
jgi:ribosomal protein L37AE/L43A